MKVKRHPVYVQWVDSGGHRGWRDPDDLNLEPMYCETLGWLVRKTEDTVTVALNGVFDNTSSAPFGEFVTIPRVAITKMRRVKAKL